MGNVRSLVTPRLEVRPPAEADRGRFVDLMCDDEFMVFFDGARTAEQAHRWFDHMLAVCDEVPFGKQPVIERASGVIVGYVGVDWFDLDNERRLEWGYRLAPQYRGLGYATEASRALLGRAADTFSGDIFALIHRDNRPSQNVASKLGFGFLKHTVVGGGLVNLYRIRLRSGRRRRG
jgi:RimJ/RimL family protein N-acetyltransferase